MAIKKPVIAILCTVLSTLLLAAQQDTEVYLVDILLDSNGLSPNTPMEVFTNLKSPQKEVQRLGTPLNISNNEGYDNQPSFLDDNTMLFASTRNNQTDIALYNINKGTKTWISDTPGGSEYLPLKFPEKRPYPLFG